MDRQGGRYGTVRVEGCCFAVLEQWEEMGEGECVNGKETGMASWPMVGGSAFADKDGAG